MPFHPDAQWISGPAYEYGADNAGYYQNHPNHVLVRRFTVTPCKTAELHIAVLGYARVMLNGRPITDAELLGDWTNPTKVVYYDTFDVASLLHEGENTLVVELGNGWYNPSPLTMFGKYNLRARLAEVGTPKALVEFNVNGETLLVSDDQWSCSEGKLLFNNVYLGETRDLAHEANELDIVCEPNVRNLESSVVERCRRFEPVEPAVLRELDNGSLLVDFGVLNTGMIDLTFVGQAGTEVVVRYAEEVDDEGMPAYESSYAGLVGMLVPEGFVLPGGPGAPEKAIQTDRILGAQGTVHFSNTFCVHSCRYAHIEGLARKDLRSITLTPVHTDLVATGNVHAENAFFEQLVNAAVRTKLNNVHGLWEDCARERLGYGGDMIALAASNLMAFDCEGLIRKTVRDFRNDQTAAGGVPETAPFVGIGSNGTAPGEGPLLWQLAYPHLVLRAYQFYGCRDLVEEEWPYVKKLVDYLLGWEPAELAAHCLGDHGSVGTAENFKSGTPDKEFVGWCTIARFARAATRFEQILGLPDSGYASRHEELCEQIKERFAREDGTFGEGTQTGIAFAADLGLSDEDELADALVAKIKVQGGILATGIFGTTIAFDLLHRTGHSDVVEHWLTREETPSFKAMLASGNGALAEQFQAFLSSYNHAMFSSYLQWFYQGLGGKENVKSVIHCATRLRFTLVDDNVPVDEEVKAIKGVLGVMKQGGMYQVIIGPTVPDVYGELTKLGVSAGGSIDEKADDSAVTGEKEKLTPAVIGNKIIDYISGSVTPLIPVLITGALFRTLSAVLGPTMLNLLPADHNFITLCNMISNAAFYFMPILVGFAAANKLSMNGYMGAFMGAALLEPSFVELAATEGAAFNILGLPVPLANYGSSLLPILLCVAVMAPLNKFITKILPAQVRTVFAPFITMLIMLPLAFCALAPAGNFVGQAIAMLLGGLAGTPFGWLATTIIAAFWAVLVLSGMHLGLAAIALAQYAQVGTDTCILLAANISAWCASGAMLALCFRMKDPEKRAEFWSFFITQFFGGVGEPMIFGVFIPYKRPFVASIIGGAVSGLLASILGVVLYTPIQGFAVPLSYIGGDNPMNEVFGVVAMVAGAVVAFIVAWIWGLSEAERNGAEPGTE